MEERSQNILLSPGFLLGLLLLLLNDFIFKQSFHNWLTGKLSDFTGLFIFPLFWTAFFPKQKKYIYLATGLGFTFWKSIYSQPLIEWWNLLPFFEIFRTVDYSDLFALSVLPLSFLYISYHHPRRFVIHRIATTCVAIISVFAFTATQRADEQSASTHYGRKYRLNTSKQNLVQQLRNTETLHLGRAEHLDTSSGPGFGEHYVITIRQGFCKDAPDAYVEIIEYESESVIKLMWIRYRCDNVEPQHEQELLAMFESKVIRQLPLISVSEEKTNP